ncbi:hypothetical protein BC832DRAFT_552792 [Gaertneriomyces semiglobifer]|nr:hypothetical protein BC832DRAFT_552792 [Gaertneriomyces semiglobifer]
MYVPGFCHHATTMSGRSHCSVRCQQTATNPCASAAVFVKHNVKLGLPLCLGMSSIRCLQSSLVVPASRLASSMPVVIPSRIPSASDSAASHGHICVRVMKKVWRGSAWVEQCQIVDAICHCPGFLLLSSLWPQFSSRSFGNDFQGIYAKSRSSQTTDCCLYTIRGWDELAKLGVRSVVLITNLHF